MAFENFATKSLSVRLRLRINEDEKGFFMLTHNEWFRFADGTYVCKLGLIEIDQNGTRLRLRPAINQWCTIVCANVENNRIVGSIVVTPDNQLLFFNGSGLTCEPANVHQPESVIIIVCVMHGCSINLRDIVDDDEDIIRYKSKQLG